MEISVLVCTYNSSEKDIAYTLDSIMEQDYENYEVIITDDGSADNHEAFIHRYFAGHNFERYQLRLGKVNVGTVRNIYEGTDIASGNYIKPIGAGDAFCDKTVLKSAVAYMREKNATIMFSGMRLFSKSPYGVVFHENKTLPFVIKPWATLGKSDKLMENIIVFNDQISGASMFYEKKYLQKMMSITGKSALYTEDLCQYIALLEGQTIYYFPKCCILYECGTGISTNQAASARKRIIKDKNSFMDYIFAEYESNPYVKRRKKMEEVERSKSNRYIKGIRKILLEPKWLYFRIMYGIKKI